MLSATLRLSVRGFSAAELCGMARKAGVVSDADMITFLAANDAAKVVVVDARNPDFSVEPGDERSAAAGPIAETAAAERPNAVNIVYDRNAKCMDLSRLEPRLDAELGKATPIITHCGGGGRGQKAKLFLEAAGYTNVINGGGPKVAELWASFGSL